MSQQIKIKLGAIARDEAAYLPEWIFHHLHFGVDEIEVYVNNTADNSYKVLANIAKHYPVKIINADKLFKLSGADFQTKAYQQITEKAQGEGFTHMLFLDIDEFWTPADFSTSIKEALSKYDFPDVLNFNWFIHCDETEYANCYKRQFNIQQNPHVKTLFKLNAPWDKVSIHNVLGQSLIYTRGDGSTYNFGNSTHCGISDAKCLHHDFYVIHRMYRSQKEYISLLGRGRANKMKLKDNRPGYYSSNGKFTTIAFKDSLLNRYYQDYNTFLLQCNLSRLLKSSHLFIDRRYHKVIDWARKSSSNDAHIFLKLFNNIELPEIVDVRQSLLKKITMLPLELALASTPKYSYLFLLLLTKLLKQLRFNQLALKVFLRAVLAGGEVDEIKMLANIENALTVTGYPIDKKADIYREIAIRFYQNNELSLACAFIAKAKQLRPRGPRIIQLYQEYMKENQTGIKSLYKIAKSITKNKEKHDKKYN